MDVLEELLSRLPDNSAIFLAIAAGAMELGLNALLYYNGAQNEAEALFKNVLELSCVKSVDSGMMPLKELLHLADCFYPPGLRYAGTV